MEQSEEVRLVMAYSYDNTAATTIAYVTLAAYLTLYPFTILSPHPLNLPYFMGDLLPPTCSDIQSPRKWLVRGLVKFGVARLVCPDLLG